MTPILVYTYRDMAEFQTGAAYMAQGGYYPIAQSWKPGATSRNPLLLLLGLLGLLFFILPGVILLIIWAAYVKTGPNYLTVTYQLTGALAEQERAGDEGDAEQLEAEAQGGPRMTSLG